MQVGFSKVVFLHYTEIKVQASNQSTPSPPTPFQQKQHHNKNRSKKTLSEVVKQRKLRNHGE
jgi:hypothetical protein